jgi:hypothetical protein
MLVLGDPILIKGKAPNRGVVGPLKQQEFVLGCSRTDEHFELTDHSSRDAAGAVTIRQAMRTTAETHQLCLIADHLR